MPGVQERLGLATAVWGLDLCGDATYFFPGIGEVRSHGWSNSWGLGLELHGSHWGQSFRSAPESRKNLTGSNGHRRIGFLNRQVLRLKFERTWFNYMSEDLICHHPQQNVLLCMQAADVAYAPVQAGRASWSPPICFLLLTLLFHMAENGWTNVERHGDLSLTVLSYRESLSWCSSAPWAWRLKGCANVWALPWASLSYFHPKQFQSRRTRLILWMNADAKFWYTNMVSVYYDVHFFMPGFEPKIIWFPIFNWTRGLVSEAFQLLVSLRPSGEIVARSHQIPAMISCFTSRSGFIVNYKLYSLFRSGAPVSICQNYPSIYQAPQHNLLWQRFRYLVLPTWDASPHHFFWHAASPGTDIWKIWCSNCKYPPQSEVLLDLQDRSQKRNGDTGCNSLPYSVKICGGTSAVHRLYTHCDTCLVSNSDWAGTARFVLGCVYREQICSQMFVMV